MYFDVFWTRNTNYFYINKLLDSLSLWAWVHLWFFNFVHTYIQERVNNQSVKINFFWPNLSIRSVIRMTVHAWPICLLLDHIILTFLYFKKKADQHTPTPIDNPTSLRSAVSDEGLQLYIQHVHITQFLACLICSPTNIFLFCCCRKWW